MESPQITPDQIQQRCTEQSFTRGLEYFHDGAIGNPTLHGYTLSATCEGTDIDPYHVTVELMSTGISSAYCSCPYDWEGDCKHIVALLLTYVDASDTILSLEPLFTTLEAQPKSSLLQIISELLKHAPELAPIVQAYSDTPGTPQESRSLPLVAAYQEQVDGIFENSFIEQHQFDRGFTQLEVLQQKAELLGQQGKVEHALSILHALIQRSVVHFSDISQKNGLLEFVEECLISFAEIALDAPESVTILEHCRMLLRLSFDTEQVFTPLLTSSLAELCWRQEIADLPVVIEQDLIEQGLDKSPDRQAHVQLLLTLYFQAGRTEDYHRLAQSEEEE
ncbi:hypothetical protein F4X33_00330 [Candidatus Poribacteria bacterium]|nr:hypothetical protein [Candidatus Poribacteria bacterium]